LAHGFLLISFNLCRVYRGRSAHSAVSALGSIRRNWRSDRSDMPVRTPRPRAATSRSRSILS